MRPKYKSYPYGHKPSERSQKEVFQKSSARKNISFRSLVPIGYLYTNNNNYVFAFIHFAIFLMLFSFSNFFLFPPNFHNLADGFLFFIKLSLTFCLFINFHTVCAYARFAFST